jgi:hypothetical protein
MPGMRVASHLHDGAQLTERRHGSSRGQITRTASSITSRRLASGPSRCAWSFFGTPSQVLVALCEIEHQPFCVLILHPFGMGAELYRALAQTQLAQTQRVDQRMIWHDKRTTAAGNRSAAHQDYAKITRLGWWHPATTWRAPTALQRLLDEFLTGSGTFPDRVRSGLDTVGTARAGSAPASAEVCSLSERDHPRNRAKFQSVLRCGELLRTQRSSEGEHARRNRRYEDERSRRTG